MNNTDDKPKVGRDWIAFVVAWIPYSLLTYRFWHNIDDGDVPPDVEFGVAAAPWPA